MIEYKWPLMKLHKYGFVGPLNTVNNTVTEEIYLNVKGIFRFEKSHIYCQQDKKRYPATKILMDEYVSKYEPKKVIFVEESAEEIYKTFGEIAE